MTGRALTDLVGIELESLLAPREGDDVLPRVTIRVEHDGGVAIGQLDVPEAERMALQWLQVCATAADDAALYRLLTVKLEQPVELAGRLIADLRSFRKEEERA